MDVFNIPNTQINTNVFHSTGSASWQTWNKPLGCKFVSMFAISGGGGGGGGAGQNPGANSNGGGGGAASGTAFGIFPANVLPDTVYILVGLGGAGGGPGVNGSVGGITYVSAQPNTTSINVIIAGTSNTAGGGFSGTNGGAGGNTPTAFSKTSTGLLGASGIITSTNGWPGAAGGVGNSSLAGNIAISGITTGGAGGGAGTSSNVDNLGGRIVGNDIVPTISGGTSGQTGSFGYTSLIPSIGTSARVPMVFTGGAGGGSKVGGLGGKGGGGSYGCGGGGAGSGAIASGGTGGAGGNGLVVITCF